MQRRHTAGKTAPSANQLMLRCILKIKERREEQLRMQISALENQQQQVADDQYHCQQCRDELHTTLADLLAWHGTLSSRKLVAKKQQMGKLFNQERELATLQQALLNTSHRLASQQGKRQAELFILMKKKEKIRMALADEHDKN